MKQFTGKVCVVTGAASGIGQATAIELARRDAVVCLADLNEVAMAATVNTIRDSGGAAHPYIVDVSKREAIYKFAQQVENDHGAASLVMNNAGVMTAPQVLDALSNEDLDWLLGINLWAVINGTRAFLPQLRRNDEANIVNVSSLAGLIGITGFAHYCAAKSGVRGFSEAVRMDLLGTGISVTTVYPGAVATGIVVNGRGYTDEQREAATTRVAMMPQVTSEAAALKIIRAIQKNRGRVLIGREAIAMDLLPRLLPSAYVRLLHPIMKRYTSGVTIPARAR